MSAALLSVLETYVTIDIELFIPVCLVRGWTNFCFLCNNDKKSEIKMMKNKNHMKMIYAKDKGWRWFGLALALQILFIGVNYLAMMS